ncbi:MAG: cytochrome c biogenesis protein CcsA [Lentisphaeria bacterium]|nr:cytochrome c biogenesis protein CcsA [Lentisphaeria bacterium]
MSTPCRPHHGPVPRRGLIRGCGVCVLVALAAAAWPACPGSHAAASRQGLPTELDVTPLRDLVVQHDGRTMPLDTLARDLVTEVCGTAPFAGTDPVLMLLGWTFDGGAWAETPLIPVGNARLRTALGLPAGRRRFAFNELVEHERFRALLEDLDAARSGRPTDPLHRKVARIRERLVTFQNVLRGTALRIVPQASDPDAPWGTAAALLTDEGAGVQGVRSEWVALAAAYLSADGQGFADAVRRFRAGMDGLPAAHRPSPVRMAREVRYNRLRPFRLAWIALAVGAGLAAVALGVRRRWCDGAAALVTLAAFAVFTHGLVLRWGIAGRIPAANMFESLLFMSWGAAAMALLAFLFLPRQRSVPLTAAIIGAVSLCLADCLPLDSFVRPAAPVLLDTFWMSVHVPVIMIAYAVLAIAVLIAHVQVAVAAIVPAERPAVVALDRYHYGYLMAGSLLLLLGIVTGSMWAASSWGRYWGWDPKEVWSLIALLGYMTILHVRVSPPSRPTWRLGVTVLLATGAVLGVVGARLAPLSPWGWLALGGAVPAVLYFALARGVFAIAVKSILAFWLIIMTYVGVNYVLGTGLHSYGFGAGAVAGRMCAVGAADLTLLLAFLCVHAVRQRRRQA